MRYYLEQCLLSVEKALCGVCGEVFVVDNNSTDDSMPYLKSKFPWVRYIENDENVGFSRANNQAIREARGEYVLLLNPDTFIGERSLRECIEFMDKTPQAGMCGVGMLRIDGSFAPESRRGIPTPFVAFCKMSGLGALFPKSRLFGRYYMQYLNKYSINPIEIVSGAFMFIRKAALDKVGLLDETFFMYGEDIDLSYRVLQAGYKNYYLPTQILHYKGESTKHGDIKYVKDNYGLSFPMTECGWDIPDAFGDDYSNCFKFLSGIGDIKKEGSKNHLDSYYLLELSLFYFYSLFLLIPER